MTLNIGYLTQEYALLVSDRRLTGPEGAIHDDKANKATVVCGRMVLAYTGRAQIRLERTDEWVTKVLASSGFRSSSDAAKILQAEATRYFTGVAATPRQRRHAFVAVGWTKSQPEDPLRPHSLLISNFHDDNGVESPTALPEFRIIVSTLSADHTPFLLQVPRHLSEAEVDALRSELLPLQSRPQEMALVLAQAIRRVAGRDETVGKDLLAVCLPKVAVEKSVGTTMLLYGPLSQTALGSVYLPADSNEVIQRAPNFACAGTGFTRASGGPL